MRQYLTISAALLLCSTLAGAQGKGKGKGGGGGDHGKSGDHGKAAVVVAPTQGKGPKIEHAQKPAKIERTDRVIVQQPQRGREKDNEHAIAKANRIPPGIVNAREHGGRARALGVEKHFGGEVALPPAMPRVIALTAPVGKLKVRELVVDDAPVAIRPLFISERPEVRLAAKTVALALVNGAPADAIFLQPQDRGVLVLNRDRVVLFGLDDNTASNLGYWRVARLNDDVKSDAPSFCRSGAGHPVFGRQWCLDKGFGLGAETSKIRWGRANVSDIVFTQQPTTEQLITTAVLRQVLGPTAFDRLAVQAATLGLVDPLTATWMGQPNTSRILYVHSGTAPVAEFVDANRDGRAETMLVVLPPR
jgi:hypothetical protein